MKIQDFVLLFALSALPMVVAQSDASDEATSAAAADAGTAAAAGGATAAAADAGTAAAAGGATQAAAAAGATQAAAAGGATQAAAPAGATQAAAAGGATQAAAAAGGATQAAAASGATQAAAAAATTTTTTAKAAAAETATQAAGAVKTCATFTGCAAGKISVPSADYGTDGSSCCQDAKAAVTAELTARLTALKAAFNSVKAVSNVAAPAVTGLSGTITMAAPTGGKAKITGLKLEAASVAEANTKLATMAVKCPIIAAISQDLVCVLMKLTMAGRRLGETEDEFARRLAEQSGDITMEPHTDVAAATAGLGAMCATTTDISKTGCPTGTSYNNFGYCNATTCAASDLAMGFCCEPGQALCVTMTSAHCGTNVPTTDLTKKCAANPCLPGTDAATCCTAPGTTGTTPSNAMMMSAAAAFAALFFQ